MLFLFGNGFCIYLFSINLKFYDMTPENFTTLISAIIVIIVLITFFVMASRLRDIKDETKRTSNFLALLIQNSIQDLKSKGMNPEYFVYEGKVRIKNKTTGEIETKNLFDWNYMKKEKSADDYELVPFEDTPLTF